MAQTLADLLVSLDLDSAKFTENVKKSQEKITGFASIAAEASKRIEHLLEFDLVIRGAEKLYEFLKSSAEAADKLGNMATAAGVSVEEFQRLAYAGKMVDVEADQLTGGLEKLARNMAKAGQGGGDAARAFRALHIETKNADGTLRGTNEVFGDVAEAFSHMENGADKTALSMMLFGKSGASLIPLLNEGKNGIDELGSAAERAGKIMGEDVVRGAEQFTRALKSLDGGMKVVGAMVATDVAPAFSDLVASFTEGADGAANFATASDGLSTVLKTIAGSALVLESGLSRIGTRFTYLINLRQAFWEAWDKGDGDYSKLYRLTNGLDESLKRESELYNRRMEMLGFGTDQLLPRPSISGLTPADEDYEAARSGNYLGHHEEVKLKAPVIEGGEEFKKAKEKIEHLIDEYRAKLVKAQGGSEVDVLAARISQGDLKDVFAELGKQGEGLKTTLLDLAAASEAAQATEKLTDSLAKLDEELAKVSGKAAGTSELDKMYERLARGDLSKELQKIPVSQWGAFIDKHVELGHALDVETEKHKSLRLAMESFSRTVEEVSAAYDSLATPAERYAREVEKLNRLFGPDSAFPDQQMFSRGLKESQKAYAQAGGELSKIDKDLARDLASGFSSTLEEQLVTGFKNGADGALAAFGDMLQRMLAKAAAAKITEAIFGPGIDGLLGLFGGGKGIPDSSSGLLAMTGAQLPGRAGGGSVRSGAAYLVGEEGPEVLLTGNTSGTIIPHGDTAEALSGFQASSLASSSAAAPAGNRISIAFNVSALDSQSTAQHFRANAKTYAEEIRRLIYKGEVG